MVLRFGIVQRSFWPVPCGIDWFHSITHCIDVYCLVLDGNMARCEKKGL